eukprot:TRINITY_DN2344_c0_g2_i1.p1 TRINITY_DN2344_c0_g2~~TRINITY_DN2344_c0_g2_i1.p1  ORF type:complete len:861 (+),score=354.23 TRINITY_DN2344_c0_g2_i1:2-2584(+)
MNSLNFSPLSILSFTSVIVAFVILLNVSPISCTISTDTQCNSTSLLCDSSSAVPISNGYDCVAGVCIAKQCNLSIVSTVTLNVTCGTSSGAISVYANNDETYGTTTYTIIGPDKNETSSEYEWMNLVAGSYSIRIKRTTSAGVVCVDATETVTVYTSQDNLVLNVSSVSGISGCAGSSGEIIVTPHGGSGPYTFYQSQSSNTYTNVISRLPVGKYVVRVVDYAGCSASTEEIEITKDSRCSNLFFNAWSRGGLPGIIVIVSSILINVILIVYYRKRYLPARKLREEADIQKKMEREQRRRKLVERLKTRRADEARENARRKEKEEEEDEMIASQLISKNLKKSKSKKKRSSAKDSQSSEKSRESESESSEEIEEEVREERGKERARNQNGEMAIAASARMKGMLGVEMTGPSQFFEAKDAAGRARPPKSKGARSERDFESITDDIFANVPVSTLPEIEPGNPLVFPGMTLDGIGQSARISMLIPPSYASMSISPFNPAPFAPPQQQQQQQQQQQNQQIVNPLQSSAPIVPSSSFAPGSVAVGSAAANSMYKSALIFGGPLEPFQMPPSNLGNKNSAANLEFAGNEDEQHNENDEEEEDREILAQMAKRSGSADDDEEIQIPSTSPSRSPNKTSTLSEKAITEEKEEKEEKEEEEEHMPNGEKGANSQSVEQSVESEKMTSEKVSQKISQKMESEKILSSEKVSQKMESEKISTQQKSQQMDSEKVSQKMESSSIESSKSSTVLVHEVESDEEPEKEGEEQEEHIEHEEHEEHEEQNQSEESLEHSSAHEDAISSSSDIEDAADNEEEEEESEEEDEQAARLRSAFFAPVNEEKEISNENKLEETEEKSNTEEKSTEDVVN